MRSHRSISHAATTVLGVLTGLVCLSVAAVAQAPQADESRAEELQMLSRYEAALAEGDQATAVKHVLDYAEKTFGKNDPATAKLTHRYGQLLYEEGEYREATKVLKTALERSTAAHGRFGGEAFEINMNIGYCYSHWSPSLATRTKYFDRALEVLRERGEHETIEYVTTLINIVVNLMDNNGLSGEYSTAVVDNFDTYQGDDYFLMLEHEYINHFDKAEKYILEAAELSQKLEDVDEYLSAKIAVAQAKLNVMETADLAAVPAGVSGRITRGTASKRYDREQERLVSAIDKLSRDIDKNRLFLTAANKALMEIAWLGKDKDRMDAMCADGTLDSASEYHPDRLFRVEADGSVLAPDFSFRISTNIFKPLRSRPDEPTDKDGNPVKKPYFVPVCVDGQLMAALVNAPLVTIEEL